MSSRASGAKPEKSFYASIEGGKTKLSRFRVYLKPSEAPSRSSRRSKSKNSQTHWTFKADPRRPRHGQQELDPIMKDRHADAVSEFCRALTSNNYSTTSNVEELSTSVISKAEQFRSSPSENGSRCRLWASNMTEYHDTKEIEFKVIVGDAVTYGAAVGDESGPEDDAPTYKATVEDDPEDQP